MWARETKVKSEGGPSLLCFVRETLTRSPTEMPSQSAARFLRLYHFVASHKLFRRYVAWIPSELSSRYISA